MKFEFDDDHYAQRDAIGRYLADNAGAAALRRYWDQDSRDTTLWSGLAGLGVLSLTVTEAHGGAGMGLCDAALLIEELGRYAVPHPVAEALGVVVPVLQRCGDEQMRSDWLPGIVRGNVMASIQDGWDGQAAWGAEAQLVLVAHDDGVSLCRPSPKTQRIADPADPARRPARLVRADEFARLEGAASVRLMRDCARTVLAQFLLGLSSVTIARAVDYAKGREQFGRPIGSFQAVKHMLANAHVAVETARRATWHAAWCIDHDHAAAGEAAAIAKGSAAEAAVEASYAGLQVHGAIGYTWECDLHFWLKRIHALEGQFGGARALWRELADMTFDDFGAVT